MCVNDKSAMAIAETLGERLKRARLNANLTQLDVADQAGISRKAVLNAEKGKAQLETFIAILMALDMVDHIHRFLPEQAISPIELAKLQGKKRQRASRHQKNTNEDLPEW